MRFIVDLRECQDYAQCVTASQEFKLDARGRLMFHANKASTYGSAELPESRRAELEDAVMLCPAQAIEIVE